jgi:hypothetical protein
MRVAATEQEFAPIPRITARPAGRAPKNVSWLAGLIGVCYARAVSKGCCREITARRSR